MADQLNGNAALKPEAAAASNTQAGFSSFAEFEAQMAKDGEDGAGGAAQETSNNDVRPSEQIADQHKGQGSTDLAADEDGDEDLTPEQLAAAEKGEELTATQKAEAEAAKGPKKVSLKARLGELTREKHEVASREAAALARAEAAEERARLAEEAAARGEKPTARKAPNTDQEAPITDAAKPNAEDFEFGEYDPKYQDALVEWRVEKTLAKAAAKVQEANQAQAERTAEAERTQKWGGVIEKGAAAKADFEEKVLKNTSGWKLSRQMWELAVDSEVGHDVLYELANDPAESDRIFNLPLARQAVEFGKLEARFSQPSSDKGKSEVKDGATGHMPRAPKPQSAVRGAGGQFKPDAGTKDFAAFEAMIANESAAKAQRV